MIGVRCFREDVMRGKNHTLSLTVNATATAAEDDLQDPPCRRNETPRRGIIAKNNNKRCFKANNVGSLILISPPNPSTSFDEASFNV